ncbi:hypothetical protein V6N12_031072 [Hibiscus sabdariffa]|uniref:Uncharacterized protein n=1 Tax=Hibiscus sabdariffa TaxID=183260 RepID=A0ABR2E7U3_9ROSI
MYHYYHIILNNLVLSLTTLSYEAIKKLQDASAQHEQSLIELRTAATENKQTLQDVLRQLTTISAQLGQPAQSIADQEGSSHAKTLHGKGKLKEELDEVKEETKDARCEF